MRIIHIVPALSKGGGERVAVDLANHAARQGHDVTVVAVTRVDETLLRNHLVPEVAVVYVAQSAGRLRRYADVACWTFAKWPWLRSADVIHCHMTISAVIGTLVYWLRKLTRQERPAVVETYHAVGMPIPRWHRRAHAFLAGRRDALALMAEDGFWSEFTRKHSNLASATIPNGISHFVGAAPTLQKRQTYRRRIGMSDSCSVVVGTIGRLAPARRPWLYPPIFERIAQRLGPQACFAIGGTGPELGRLKAEIQAHHLEGRVHLLGLVQEPRLPLSVMNLYLTLNVGPTTGVAALEAAFAGVPVIAIQLLDDYRASPQDWIWSSQDLDAVADRAVELLRDPQRLRTLAQRQQAHARAHHGVEAMAEAYESLYEAALARARARPRLTTLVSRRTTDADRQR